MTIRMQIPWCAKQNDFTQEELKTLFDLCLANGVSYYADFTTQKEQTYFGVDCGSDTVHFYPSTMFEEGFLTRKQVIEMFELDWDCSEEGVDVSMYTHTTPLTENPDPNEWTDKHYANTLKLRKHEIEAIKQGDMAEIPLDVYRVSTAWGIACKEPSGALWHMFKTFPRFGDKNSVEREVQALYAQCKCLARELDVELKD